MHKLARLDHQHIWHPFTQMADWLKKEPIIIASGKKAVLKDVYGRRYLDANSSIWTNLHGHHCPSLNRALERQLRKIGHSSFLGLSNEPAALLAGRLIGVVNADGSGPEGTGARDVRRARTAGVVRGEPAKLRKVFYSDDGSTAMEVAVKLGYEFSRRTGRCKRPRFLSLNQAYHGDTLGAASLGHIDLFQRSFGGLLFQSDRVMAPYCYRCPFNQAEPQRADARAYRQCSFQCLDEVEKRFIRQKRSGEPYAAMVVEPLIQGAAGMIPQPPGWLKRVEEISRSYGSLLIADEVMTGFGRTEENGGLFACQQENVAPDLMALGKGMTGGYLPMAATLTTSEIFQAFLGEYGEFKTFFHGHSYTGNQLGSAAALASLDLLEKPGAREQRARLRGALNSSLETLWSSPWVGDIRRVGLVAGIELVKNWRTREPFLLEEQAGLRVCEAMSERGVLTRPIGNVIVLMPPYCCSGAEVERMAAVLLDSIQAVLGSGAPSAARGRPRPQKETGGRGRSSDQS